MGRCPVYEYAGHALGAAPPQRVDGVLGHRLHSAALYGLAFAGGIIKTKQTLISPNFLVGMAFY